MPKLLKQDAATSIKKIDSKIHVIRVQRVLLDSDLAELYGVPTSALNQAVKRNIERFPDDFAFQLSDSEFESLISQIVTSKVGRGGRTKRPLVFTEQGVAMLSGVLHSPTAVQVNIEIMRAFVRMRRLLATPAGCRKSGIGILPVGVGNQMWNNSDRLEAYPTRKSTAFRGSCDSAHGTGEDRATA